MRQKLEARLVILGEGPMRPELESLARDLGVENDIDLPGFVSNPFKYMKRASVFVLSSLYEGFGNVLAEAMFLGTPVVATNCPSGPEEILEGGKWGRLVPPGDAQSLAEAIVQTLNDRNADKLFGATQRARKFAVAEVVDSYINELFPSGFVTRECSTRYTHFLGH